MNDKNSDNNTNDDDKIDGDKEDGDKNDDDKGDDNKDDGDKDDGTRVMTKRAIPLLTVAEMKPLRMMEKITVATRRFPLDWQRKKNLR